MRLASFTTAAFLSLSVGGAALSNNAGATDQPDWNPQAAAQYLDHRENWWQFWTEAQLDHRTICVSCHTVLPYALARPVLRWRNGEGGPTVSEQRMLASVEQRVSNWSQMQPYYSEAVGVGKAAQSRSTESVLNVLILASYDAQQGQIRAVTQTAFDNAWALQESTGGWNWQDFKLAPWETADSGYWGTTLLTLAAYRLPESFASDARNHTHLEQAQAYLRSAYAAQPLINQLYVLWASSKVPALLDRSQRQTLLNQLRGLQQPDGGWRNAGLNHTVRKDHSAAPAESDGFVTALVVLGLRSTGTTENERMLQRAEAWLRSHQRADGSWPAASMNKLREPKGLIAPFMSDAATGYAALALIDPSGGCCHERREDQR
jgi:squalene-hopene/tetraprenyl-beta-curcumene cyclase